MAHNFVSTSCDLLALRTLVDRAFATVAEDIRTQACLDEYLRDQLVIFQALAEGRSEVFSGAEEAVVRMDGKDKEKGTLHTQTAEWVCNEILEVVFKNGVCEQGVGFAGGKWTDLTAEKVAGGRSAWRDCWC